MLFYTLRHCDNQTLDEWIDIDEHKTQLNEQLHQRNVSRKKRTIRCTKEKFKTVKVPDDYPKLTKAAVMLSASVHLMDSYLKQMHNEQS